MSITCIKSILIHIYLHRFASKLACTKERHQITIFIVLESYLLERARKQQGLPDCISLQGKSSTISNNHPGRDTARFFPSGTPPWRTQRRGVSGWKAWVVASKPLHIWTTVWEHRVEPGQPGGLCGSGSAPGSMGISCRCFTPIQPASSQGVGLGWWEEEDGPQPVFLEASDGTGESQAERRKKSESQWGVPGGRNSPEPQSRAGTEGCGGRKRPPSEMRVQRSAAASWVPEDSHDEETFTGRDSPS